MNNHQPIWQEHGALGPFEFWGLTDDDGTLTIRLRGTERDLVLAFDSYLVYRKYDEGDALASLKELSREHATVGRFFYSVEPSAFMDWFTAESLGVRDGQGLKHYMIVCSNDFIDVISLEPPRIIVE